MKDDTFAAFISEQYINEDLTTVPGIGPATATKLKDAGVEVRSDRRLPPRSRLS
jgi:predicted flap endonuclease-1-like 5' DNA nuclease